MTKEERYIEDELQLKYIKDWQTKKTIRRHQRIHHCSMIKLHLKRAFEHFVLLFRNKGGCENE